MGLIYWIYAHVPNLAYSIGSVTLATILDEDSPVGSRMRKMVGAEWLYALSVGL